MYIYIYIYVYFALNLMTWQNSDAGLMLLLARNVLSAFFYTCRSYVIVVWVAY